MLLAVGFELLHRQRFTRLDDDPGLDRLAAVRVRDTAHTDLQHFRMCSNSLFHLPRPDLETSGLDEFLFTVNDVEIPILVHTGDVAGKQPGLAILQSA